MPSRGVRDRSPPGLLASKADAGVHAVRRGGRTRKAQPDERIGRANHELSGLVGRKHSLDILHDLWRQRLRTMMVSGDDLS